MTTPFYERDGITVYCGDCLEVMPGLEPPFDALISDWPYGTTACSWDSIMPLEPLWEQCKRLVKKRGTVVTTASQPFTSVLVMSNLEWFRYDLAWDKKTKTGHLNASIMPLRRHETILVFSAVSNGQFTYNPQMIKGKFRQKGGTGKNGGVYGKHNVYIKFNDCYHPSSVLEISRGSCLENLHPTQKPVDLMAYLIRAYTNPGDIVLDNAMGSGSTLVAAQCEGRRAVGVELSEEYCQVAVERLASPTFFSLPQQTNGKPKPEQLVLGFED